MYRPSRQRTFRFIVSVAFILGVAYAPSGNAQDADGPRTQASIGLGAGERSFASGQFEKAIAEWTDAYSAFADAGDADGIVLALARRAEAYQALGYYRKSIEDLTTAIALARADDDEATVARLRGSLGNVYFLAGRPARSETELKACLAFANRAQDKALAATTLNNLGNLLASNARAREAADAFADSHRLATETDAIILAATASLNAAHLAFSIQDYGETKRLLIRALEGFQQAPPSDQTAMGLIATGRLLQRLSDRLQQSSAQRNAAIYTAFDTARRIAVDIGDDRAKSYAYGYLGQLYERAERIAEAQQLTRQALFSAQKVSSGQLVYLWQWQLGRLYRAQGDDEAALIAYRQAVGTLRTVRRDTLSAPDRGSFSFETSVTPVFLEFVDLLLEKSASLKDPQLVQAHLVEARQIVELFKTAELEDYFRDECVAELQAKAKPIDRLAARTAALYPILLDERLELLLSLPEAMVRVTVPVGAATVTAQIRDFRHKLETRTTREYLRPAQALYDWLIRPIRPTLVEAGIDTLVFIPGGPLRNVPIAPLHDGSQYLIEQYAIAVAPGLSLVDPRPLRTRELDLLIAGVSKKLEGFSSLPFVTRELRTVQELFGGKLFLDDKFRISDIERELDARPYSIVHFASHAQISGDRRKSFLRAFDGPMSMDDIEKFVKFSQFRDKPIELLTLSACETAAGDDRAGLGLAGIAIKAGARSSLASLWFINDEATAVLMSRFYEGLKGRDISKAEALRQAQLALISDRRFHHPSYWSPYLLIGNWL